MKTAWIGMKLTCPACRGSGVFKEKTRLKCSCCGGTGKSEVIPDGRRV